VSDCFLGSDHLAILIQIGKPMDLNKSSKIFQPKIKWNINDVNWSNYFKDVDESIRDESLGDLNPLNVSVRYQNSSLNYSAQINILLKKPTKFKSKYPVSWDSECFL
jgi:hypothetical protein